MSDRTNAAAPGALARMLRAEPHELRALAWAFAYFFCLLCAYYILRPVRDELAVQAGTAALQWLFTATLVAMLALVPVFGWLCARLPRARLLPAVYAFFVLNLAGFWLALESGLAPARVAAPFFVWVSVFNLFAVSVFWSFMSDIFDARQAARLYGAVAAGGSCGAIAGPALTALAAPLLGPARLLLVSAALLAAAIGCITMLARWSRRYPRASYGALDRRPDEPLGGSIVAGVRAVASSPYLLGICGYLMCYTALSTGLYFLQVEIVGREIPDSAERTRLFAALDLTVNGLTLAMQLLAFARLSAVLGLAWMLALMPLVSALGFVWLGAAPTLAVLIVFGVARRVGEFSIAKPAREELFTVVAREERYKAKNFIDTVVYRGGDAASAWLVGLLRGAGLGVSALALLAVPVAAAWFALGIWLGRRQTERVGKPV